MDSAAIRAASTRYTGSCCTLPLSSDQLDKASSVCTQIHVRKGQALLFLQGTEKEEGSAACGRGRPFCPGRSLWGGEQGHAHLVVQRVQAQAGCRARRHKPAVQEVTVQVGPSLCKGRALLR